MHDKLPFINANCSQMIDMLFTRRAPLLPEDGGLEPQVRRLKPEDIGPLHRALVQSRHLESARALVAGSR